MAVILTTAQRSFLKQFLLVAGPGLVVMLADTDAGSITTAAQSGAVWGYKLLLLQFILMPILYIAQELTLRLGLVTGKGHGELIAETFGKFWAWISVLTLVVCCIGAIITEFSGLAGVGTLFNIPKPLMMTGVVTFLIIMAWTGSYHSVERIAIAIGLFELAFLWVAVKAHPNWHEVQASLTQIPWQNKSYLFLAAANIGAVIMPWMIFYQQSAVIDKGLTKTHLNSARVDTAIGSVVTQLVMAAALMTTAATIGKAHPNTSLDTVHQISNALIPYLGISAGKLVFALGMSGAALVATIVVSLTAAWGLGEVMGFKRSLEHHPVEAPWFYSIYTVCLICGAILVCANINLVHLNIAVEVMNALLLPLVLGFLYLLAIKALPEPYRLKGKYAVFVGVILGVTALFGLWAGLSGS